MGQHLGVAALTELWSLIKGNFARKVAAAPASTTVDIQLQTEGAQTLNTATIPAATTTTAGVFTAADKSKLDGIAEGADKSDAYTKAEVNERLNGKADATHTHVIADTTGLQAALDGKAAASHMHANATTNAAGYMSATDKKKLDGIEDGANAYELPRASVSEIGGLYNYDADSDTGVPDADKSGGYYTAVNVFALNRYMLQANERLNGKADSSDVYTKSETDAEFATKAEVDERLNGKAAVGHKHVIADVTGLQVALDAKASTGTATTDAAGLMSAADKSKLDGIEEGATKTSNVTVSQTQTEGHEIGGITVDGTETKLYSPKEVVDSTVTSTGENAVSGSAVSSYVAGVITGVSMFQGIVNDPTIISNLTTYKSGWYWTVGTAGTYVNQECEVGDQIYCISDFNTAYKNTDFTVVQANVTEMSATEVDQICTI